MPPPEEREVPPIVTVDHVVSGDCFVTRSGFTVCLTGVFAPRQGERGYDEALAKLASLETRKVKLARVERDDLGRVHAQVLLPVSAPNQPNAFGNVNTELVTQGFARYNPDDPFMEDELRGQYEAAEAYANANGLGIWRE